MPRRAPIPAVTSRVLISGSHLMPTSLLSMQVLPCRTAPEALVGHQDPAAVALAVVVGDPHVLAAEHRDAVPLRPDAARVEPGAGDAVVRDHDLTLGDARGPADPDARGHPGRVQGVDPVAGDAGRPVRLVDRDRPAAVLELAVQDPHAVTRPDVDGGVRRHGEARHEADEPAPADLDVALARGRRGVDGAQRVGVAGRLEAQVLDLRLGPAGQVEHPERGRAAPHAQDRHGLTGSGERHPGPAGEDAGPGGLHQVGPRREEADPARRGRVDGRLDGGRVVSGAVALGAVRRGLDVGRQVVRRRQAAAAAAACDGRAIPAAATAPPAATSPVMIRRRATSEGACVIDPGPSPSGHVADIGTRTGSRCAACRRSTPPDTGVPRPAQGVAVEHLEPHRHAGDRHAARHVCPRAAVDPVRRGVGRVHGRAHAALALVVVGDPQVRVRRPRVLAGQRLPVPEPPPERRRHDVQVHLLPEQRDGPVEGSRVGEEVGLEVHERPPVGRLDLQLGWRQRDLLHGGSDQSRRDHVLDVFVGARSQYSTGSSSACKASRTHASTARIGDGFGLRRHRLPACQSCV